MMGALEHKLNITMDLILPAGLVLFAHRRQREFPMISDNEGESREKGEMSNG
jgi:hypothetical protein